MKKVNENKCEAQHLEFLKMGEPWPVSSSC